MPDTEVQPSACPACDSDDVDYWPDVSSWRCDECSYIFQEDHESEYISDTEGIDESPPEDEDQLWEESVPVKDQSEANLISFLSQVEEIAEGVSASDKVVIRSAEILTQAWKTNFTHGRTQEDTVAAAIYIATRETGQSIPPGVLAEVAGTEKKPLKMTYKQLKEKQGVDLPPPTPEEYVDYFCSCLDLSVTVRDDSKELLTARKPRGGNPIGIAAAAVYETTENETITLRQLADAAILTKETVWRHASQLRDDT